MLYKKIKRRIFEIVEIAQDGDTVSKIFDWTIIVLIVVNMVSVIMETFTLSKTTADILSRIELVSIIIFTVEYILRVWTADLLFPQFSAAKSRIKFIFSFMAIIDLLAILPFYIPLIIHIDLRVLRLLRLIRVLRLLKVNRYTNALSTIGKVFRRKATQLLSSFFVVLLLMIIASVLMYNIENAAQPNQFENAFSALWWAIATLTTVGYGDIYPVTVAGKILSSVIALLGIGLVAVPTGIISAGFMECIGEEKEDHAHDEKHYCPYCGHKID